MATYYPPTNFFPNINFNNDFYAIPNNNQGISLAYANTHFLFSTGVATSTAISTYFSGSVGIGTISGTAGTLIALTLNAINSIQINGTDISTIYATSNYALTLSTNNSNYTSNVSNILNTKFNLYQPIINTYTVSGATGGSMAFASGILTLNMPTTYTSLSVASLTSATSIIYKGAEISATYQPIINTFTVSGGNKCWYEWS